MPKDKISRDYDEKIVFFTKDQKVILSNKRKKAMKIMELLMQQGIPSIAHGSIARGDVTQKSDIDIVVPFPIPSYKIEIALENTGYKIYEKQIIQATPSNTPKAYLILDPNEETIISFPLTRLLPRETEFYKFGGAVTLEDITVDKRVPGVNKKLQLIIPIPEGYKVTPVIGNESKVASLLGISIETVQERIRVLTRRDKIGRTGVYLKIIVPPYSSIENELEKHARKNPVIRRVLEERGG